MKIAICAATTFELPAFLLHKNDIQTFTHGTGIAQTAFNLGKRFSQNKPDICIQVGLGGAYDRGLQLGEVVIVQEDRFADMGAENSDESLIHLSKLDFINPTLPFESEKLIVQNPFMDTLNGVKTLVRSITVNTTSGSKKTISKWENMYSPQIETMEGAAFLACCNHESIPCLQIRSISNYVEPRNKENWNIPLALKSLETELIYILELLKNP